MNVQAESDLALELADEIAPLLADRDRDLLFVLISAGHTLTVMTTMMQIIADRRRTVPIELGRKIDGWLDAYTHSDDAPRLHELLCSIQ